jgi:hypothetical protein
MTTTCGSCTSAAACTALESPQSLHLGGAASAGRARGGLRGGWARAHHTSSGWRLRYPRMCGSDSRSTRIQPASPLTPAPRWETSSSWHKYAFNRKRTTDPGRHVSEKRTTGHPGSPVPRKSLQCAIASSARSFRPGEVDTFAEQKQRAPQNSKQACGALQPWKFSHAQPGLSSSLQSAISAK